MKQELSKGIVIAIVCVVAVVVLGFGYVSLTSTPGATPPAKGGKSGPPAAPAPPPPGAF